MANNANISNGVKDVLSNLQWNHKKGTVHSLEIVKIIYKDPDLKSVIEKHNLLNIKHKNIPLDLLLNNSLAEVRGTKNVQIELNELLLGVLKTIGSKKYGKVKNLLQSQSVNKASNKINVLEKSGVIKDMTADYTNLKLKSVIGRKKLEEDLIVALGRKYKNSVLIAGPKGSGKTSLVISLANRIKHKDVPTYLSNAKLISVNLAQLLSSSSDLADKFQATFKTYMLEQAKKNKHTIFFFDDLHLLPSFGLYGFTPPMQDELFDLNANSILNIPVKAPTKGKSTSYQELNYTAKGRAKKTLVNRISFIAAINDDYSDRFFDSPIQDLWHILSMPDPNKVSLKRILSNKATEVARHQDLLIDDNVVSFIVKNYKKDTKYNLPPIEHCIILLDTLCSKFILDISNKHYDAERNTKNTLLNVRSTKMVNKSTKVFNKSINDSTAKPVVTLKYAIDYFKEDLGISKLHLDTEDHSLSYEYLSSHLKKSVIGQDIALDTLASILVRSRLGLKNPKKPTASILFLGPTGVGKTETARALGKAMYSSDAFLRIDMADFMEKHTVSRLVGAPPGYVGYSEGAQLIDFVTENPKCVLLFDEIEKAHPDVLNILLSILEEGELTSGDGEVVKFNKCVVILTSNIGAEQVSKMQIGFINNSFSVQNKSIEDTIKKQLKKSVKPEILNRLDDIVVFNLLSKDDAFKILDLSLEKYNLRLLKKHGVSLKVSLPVKKNLVNKGYSLEYGARELNRSLEKNLIDKVAKVLVNNVGGCKVIKPRVKNGEIYI
jgi:ATP-dependent Clp protease ATP-binding subunit ClpC